jgi:serine protease Do
LRKKMRPYFGLFVIAALAYGFASARPQQTPGSQSSSPPLSVSDIEHGLKAGVTNTRMAVLVKQYGVDFELTDNVEKQLRTAGCNSDLLLQIARNRRPSGTSDKSPSVTPSGASSAASIPVSSATRHGAPISAESLRLVSQLEPTVVAVYATGPQNYPASGVIVDPKGYIVTNRHVIEHANNVRVQLQGDQSGTLHDARVIGTDRETDIAVIKIQATERLPAAKLGNSDGVQLEDHLLAIGLRPPANVSETGVSAKGVSVVPTEVLPFFFRLDSRIGISNSGGPLFNATGELVGIYDEIGNDPGSGGVVSFALPSNTMVFVYNQLIGPEHRVIRGTLGLTWSVDKSKSDQHGLVIDKPHEGGPADQGGLRAGDVILSVNGRKIETGDDLIEWLPYEKPGSTVLVTFRRFGSNPGSATNAQTRSNESSNSSTGITPSHVEGFWSAIQLQPGIVILEINKKPASSEQDFRTVLNSLSKGKDVVLLVRDAATGCSNYYLAGTLDIDPRTAGEQIQFGSKTLAAQGAQSTGCQHGPVPLSDGLYQTQVVVADRDRLFAAAWHRVAIGVLWDEVSAKSPHEGLSLTGVLQGGPADQAGLRAGDMLLTVNGKRIQTSDDFFVAMADLNPGSSVAVTFRRAASDVLQRGTYQEMPVRVAEGVFKTQVGIADSTRLYAFALSAPVGLPATPNYTELSNWRPPSSSTSASATSSSLASAAPYSTSDSLSQSAAGGHNNTPPATAALPADAHDCIRRGVTPAPSGEKWPVVALQDVCSKGITVSFCWLVDDLPDNGWGCGGARIDAGKSTSYLEMDTWKMSCIEGHYPGTVTPDPSCSHFKIVWNATYQESGQQPPRPNVPQNPDQTAR